MDQNSYGKKTTGQSDFTPIVNVRRQTAALPPIRDVQITLSEKDARDLLRLLGQSNTCYSLYSLLLDRMDPLV